MRTPSGPTHRFSVGAKILCRSRPEDAWTAGTIIALNFRDPKWPPRKTAPYQVLLDDGVLTFVTQDVQMLCKKLALPWWSSILDKPVGYFPQHLEPAVLEKLCNGNDVNECDHRGRTALLEAIRLNWLEGVEALIKMGGDVTIVDDKKTSALHLGYMHGALMVGLLLEAKADPNCQDIDPKSSPNSSSKTLDDRPQHRTPLHYCCSKGDLESVKLLVQGNANLNIQDGQCKTPLHVAIEEKHDAIIDFLKESGAAGDLRTIDSGMKKKPKLGEKFVRKGVNANMAGKQDMTAKQLAPRRGDAKGVEILPDVNADVILDLEIGPTLDLARKKVPAELVQLLCA